jgi:hypothetical protein
MPTFGEIRFQLSKMYPAVDHDLLDGWILDGYQHVLGELDWTRLDTRVSVAIPAEYNAGTVAVTNGSASVTGTGTAWATEMTGRLFRVLTGSEYYQFTVNSTTAATLDRPYEGETATGAGYRLAQNVFRLPPDARNVQAVDGLTVKTAADLPAKRTEHGQPVYWVPSMDSYTDPPCLQIEVYPVPVEAGSLAVSFTSEATPPTLETATTLLPWVYPAAIKAYVGAQVALSIEKNVALHTASMNALGVHVNQMRKVEADARQPIALRPPVAAHRQEGRSWRGRR